MKQAAFVIALLLLTQGIDAQSNRHWTVKENDRSMLIEQHGWAPAVYATYSLDLNSLQSGLSNAPSFTNSGASPKVLSFPMPDGSFELFKMVEMSVMEPELQAKYPGFRTFSGQGVNHPLWSIKCDYTELGFHGFIMTEQGTVFIDPFSLTNLNDYVVYYKHQSGQTPHMVCEMEESLSAQPYSSNGFNNAFGKSTGSQLRTYRVAVAATGEYTAFFGGTVSAGMAAIVTSVNRVSGIYEKEVDARLVLVANNNLLVYINAATDPYTNGSGSTMLGENQANITTLIGSANYDIGHVFSTGGGGIAGLGVVCSSTNKARGVTGSSAPVGDPFDVDYVAHEMGHQFGGNHTFNSATGSCSGNRAASAAYEPGSGITIQAYAGICGTDNLAPNSIDVFHTKSFDEIYDFTTVGTGSTCPVTTSSGNAAPIIDSLTGEKYIPYNTAFRLKAYGHDPNADPIVFSWEQYDLGPAGAWNAPSGNAPLFTSILPQSSGLRVFPKLSNILTNTISPGEIYPTYARNLNFRVTLRDNKVGGGGVTHNDNPVIVHVVNVGDTFKVTYPNASGISFTQQACPTIKWKVAVTAASPIFAATVNILLSVDGGNTFPYILASNVANDGSETVTLPGGVTTTTGRIMVEAAGNIFFDINDNNFIITNSLVVAGISTPNASCSGAPTGSIDLAGNCGGLPFTYLWSNGATSEDVNGLSGGVYTVTVTNSVGATATGTFSVGTGTASSVAVTVTITSASCPSSADGSASATNVNGVAPFSYIWSNGQSGPLATGLAPATYTVTITDANTCTASTTAIINPAIVLSAPATGNYYVCQGGTVPIGQGLTASSASVGSFTGTNTFAGSPFSSSGPVTTVSTMSIPALPAGAIITSAQLLLYNVVALGSSYRSEFRVSLSGAYTLAATSVSTLTSAGAVTPNPVIVLSSFPLSGGTINLQLSETYDDAGVDATVDSVRIVITYTLPSTISWWSLPSGGVQLGSGALFNPVGTSSLPNTNTSGNYLFYAAVQSGTCSSTRTAATFAISPIASPIITGSTSFCTGGSTILNAGPGFASYSWSTGAITQTISVNSAGTYSVTVSNAIGCTATSAVTVTQLSSTPINQTITSCNSYTWPVNGQTYTASGLYSATFNSLNGCDSSFILTLVINQSTTSSGNTMSCNSFMWFGTTYTMSGNYTHTALNSSGCLHTDTLYLVVNYGSTTTASATGCDTYTWLGTTYTASGIYTRTSNNTSGCLQTDTLYLTIYNSTSTSMSASAAGCYTWNTNNVTYTISGVYTVTLVNPSGCMNTATLNLTILPGVYLNAKAILAGPYVETAALMHDSLRVNNLIPLTEPYTSAPYGKLPIGDPAGESISPALLEIAGSNAIVDWIFIELRSASNPGNVIANRRALIQRDGDIVSTDGVSPVFFSTTSPGNYWVSIKHRNHLGIMTSGDRIFTGCAVTNVDLTTPSSVYTTPSILTPPRKQFGTVFALWSADANNNKNVKYNGASNDKDPVLQTIGAGSPNNTLYPVYRMEDLNMDGKVRYNSTDNDRVIILQNVGTGTPNNILNQHTPN